jgi:hypothetical protein
MSPSRWLAALAAAAVAVATACGFLTLEQAEQALTWLARLAGASP